MRQLSGLDTMFLSFEAARWPMHITAVHVIDPSTAPEPITLDLVKDHLRSKLPLLGEFRQRLLESPLRLGRPYWVDDPEFDLDSHVHRVGVPYPGRRSDFAELIADVTSRPLDRARALWEWWLVDGLENGDVACIWKIHHAYIDGVSWVALGDAFYDREPTPRPVPPGDEWTPEPTPGTIPLLVRSLVDLAAIPRRLASVGMAGLASGQRYRELRPRFEAGDIAKTELPAAPPRTPFNARITPHRSWAYATVSLTDIKRVKDAVGVKVNDVVLSICGGALRRYLADRGELPDQSLTAAVPVSTRGTDGGQSGNQVAGMFVSLATDIDDPVERLRAVAASSRASKVMQQAMGADVIMGLAEVPPPALSWLGAAFLAWAGLGTRLPPLANVMISNVPGPQERLYFGGGEIKAVYSTGTVLDGLGLMIGLNSYCDQVDLSLTTCKEIVADPFLIADVLGDELEQLAVAVRRQNSRSASGARGRRRRA